MKIMVLNLPRNFTANDLAKLFKQYGNIQSCDLVMNPGTDTSKGFGFVEMLDHEASVAIKALNGKTIGQNKLRVKPAN